MASLLICTPGLKQPADSGSICPTIPPHCKLVSKAKVPQSLYLQIQLSVGMGKSMDHLAQVCYFKAYLIFHIHLDSFSPFMFYHSDYE